MTRCRCTIERLRHESAYDAREIMFDECMRHAEMEMPDATAAEIQDRANEMLREME